MRKNLLYFLFALFLISCGSSQNAVEFLINQKSENLKDGHYEVKNWYNDNSIYRNRRYYKKVSEKQLMEWFSKNPNYRYLGIAQDKMMSNTSKQVARFRYLNVKEQKQLKENADAQQKKQEEEQRLAKMKSDEETRLYSENTKIIQQQIANGTYRREQQPLLNVKNYYKDDQIINNNIAIKNIWEKIKDFTSKDLFTGRVVGHISHRYHGTINKATGLPEGNGTLIIGYVSENSIKGTNVQVYYEGEWQNGTLNGQGRLVNKYFADYVELYNGSWKNGLYHGSGTLMETKLNDKIEFIQYKGNFIDGKKNGKMSIIGQYKDQLSNGFYMKDITQALYQKFRFSAEAEYDNDALIKYNLIEDHEKHLNQYFAQIVKNRQESAERYKTEKCLKCEINYKKSTYPREDNSFWKGKGHMNGKLVMKNGDEYNFDFQDGKSKIVKGWFETDDYYPSFKAMILDLEKKCLEKYCQ